MNFIKRWWLKHLYQNMMAEAAKDGEKPSELIFRYARLKLYTLLK